MDVPTSRRVRLRRRLAREPWFQRLVVPFEREPTPEKWVFVIGCYNSGTRLLTEILASHPAVAALPREGVTLTDALPRPEQFGWPRMWARCVDAIRLEPSPDAARRARRAKRQWAFSFERRPLLLEKSNANAARLPFLEAYFRPAHFLHLVRNGYAVAEGIRRRARPLRVGRTEFGERYPIALCAEQWHVTEQMVRDDAMGLARVYPLTYEALTRDPIGTMRGVTDWLDLPPLPDRELRREWTVHRVTSVIRDMNAEALARLDADDRRIVEDVAGETLARYGYRPDG